MGNQPVGRPLPKHGTTQTQNKCKENRTHDLSVSEAEASSCLRMRWNYDLLAQCIPTIFLSRTP
jgi:hypothetical protein